MTQMTRMDSMAILAAEHRWLYSFLEKIKFGPVTRHFLQNGAKITKITYFIAKPF